MYLQAGGLIARCVLLLLMLGIEVRAGEEDEIVTGCHFSNAEWGANMVDRCIKDNQATRAEVLQYPAKYNRYLERCRRRNENGWAWVKTCIDNDIEAETALAEYAKDKARLVALCDAEFRHRGTAAIKQCVDQAVAGADESNKN
jgi:hypothetical protein